MILNKKKIKHWNICLLIKLKSWYDLINLIKDTNTILFFVLSIPSLYYQKCQTYLFQLSSYGGMLSYELYYEVDGYDVPTNDPDIILSVSLNC